MGIAVGTCGRCDSPIERGDLRCAICGFAVPVEDGKAPREEVAIQVQRCDGCGAVVDYDVEARAPRCAFCDSEMHLERIEDPVEQTELWLPFTVDTVEAKSAVKRWLGSLGWFRPPDLKSEARVEGVRPLWWAGWAFDADVLVSWTADSNAGAGRAAWAPHSGQVRLAFDDILVSASRGLTGKETTALADSYDLATADPEEARSEPPAETTLERFDVQRSQARARVDAAVHGVAARIIEERHVPGSRFRNVHVAPFLRSLVTRRYAFPAWVMAYRYKGEVYRAVVSGQDGARVIGKAPYSALRIAMAIFGGLLLIGALIVIGLAVAAS